MDRFQYYFTLDFMIGIDNVEKKIQGMIDKK